MKKLTILLSFVCNVVSAQEAPTHKAPPLAEPAAQIQQQVIDDNEDDRIMLEHLTAALGSVTAIATAGDPSNLAVLVPCIASAFLSVVKMIMQMCRTAPLRGDITQEQIEECLNNLPDHVKKQMIEIVMNYQKITLKKNNHGS